jgi:ammonia channel protein AmtB
MPAVLSVAVCTIQWFVIGYTIAYGEGGAVIGSLKNAFHMGVLAEPVGTIPAILFSEFQLIFEATVCAIAVGGACERGRLLPIIPFIVVSGIMLLVKIAGSFELTYHSFGPLSSMAHSLIWSGAVASLQNSVL